MKDYYSDRKRSGVLTHAAAWTNPENMFNDRSQPDTRGHLVHDLDYRKQEYFYTQRHRVGLGWQELCKGDVGTTADGCGVSFGGTTALDPDGSTSHILCVYQMPPTCTLESYEKSP